MSSNSQKFTIDDAFEMTPEDEGESGTCFGSLAFDRRPNLGTGKAEREGESESSLRYQNLENDDAPATNGNPANSASRIRWTRHPLVQKNKKVVIACFLLLLLGLALVMVGVGVQVYPRSGVSSAIFFVPGFLLLIPGAYHVIFIYCALKGKNSFQFFYLPYFEK